MDRPRAATYALCPPSRSIHSRMYGEPCAISVPRRGRYSESKQLLHPRASSLVTPLGQLPILRTAFYENPAFAWLILEDVKSSLRECRACGGVAWCKYLEATLTPGAAKAA
jgi:hypothetical protein